MDPRSSHIQRQIHTHLGKTPCTPGTHTAYREGCTRTHPGNALHPQTHRSEADTCVCPQITTQTCTHMHTHTLQGTQTHIYTHLENIMHTHVCMHTCIMSTLWDMVGQVDLAHAHGYHPCRDCPILDTPSPGKAHSYVGDYAGFCESSSTCNLHTGTQRHPQSHAHMHSTQPSTLQRLATHAAGPEHPSQPAEGGHAGLEITLGTRCHCMQLPREVGGEGRCPGSLGTWAVEVLSSLPLSVKEIVLQSLNELTQVMLTAGCRAESGGVWTVFFHSLWL